MELIVQLDPSSKQLELFGPADGHLRLIRRALGVTITARQFNLIISGAESDVNQTGEVVDRMQKHLLKHGELTADDVTGFIEQGAASAGPGNGQAVSVYANKVVEPSTKGQLQYIETMLNNDVTFCTGPAGTGKTYSIQSLVLRLDESRAALANYPATQDLEVLAGWLCRRGWGGR